jgi:hypothetical protein
VILRWDGSAWSFMSSFTLGAQLRAVWSSGPSDVVAVGYGGSMNPNGLILHYNGSSWSTVYVADPVVLESVWGSGPNDVFAVGQGSAILHWNGVQWSAMSSSHGEILLDVSGSGPNDVFAAGQGGTILHYDGTAWASMASGTSSYLSGIFVGSQGEGYAVGGGGTILRMAGPIPPTDGGPCARPVDLHCATTVSSATHGQPSAFTGWDWPTGCGGARDDTGGEVSYRLHSPISGQIQVRRAPRGGDLDLIATGAELDGGCAPSTSCLAASQNPGADVAERVTLDVTAGEHYYLVVEGWAGVASAYTIDVTCLKEP